MPFSSRSLSRNADTEIGTSCRLSDFFRAVTTISSTSAVINPVNAAAFIRANAEKYLVTRSLIFPNIVFNTPVLFFYKKFSYRHYAN